jgi:alpha-ketoglutaric semialdehyde dehydrogenase
MQITGLNIIGNADSGEGTSTFRAVNPAAAEEFPPAFHEATAAEIEQAVGKAEHAFPEYAAKSGKERARFLEAIAERIDALGDPLIRRCCEETGLPEARISGERGRTVGQLKLFGSLLGEGSWVDARIDTADPNRKPVPKPDIRSIQKALGPVGVFGASNFPLAFSVAGGDTASALAAGCPVVFKGHPAHPGTCEMIGSAIREAARDTAMPEGTFSLLQGKSADVGMTIVRHPSIKAIGFTGSFGGGKAIFDAATRRPEPIPVYAEMGSTNPVFILPGALREKGDEIAAGLVASATLGVGQFCTNPGLVFWQESDASKRFQKGAAELFHAVASAPMLTPAILEAFRRGIERLTAVEDVQVVARGTSAGRGLQGGAVMLKTSAAAFAQSGHLEEEVFGPSTLAVGAQSRGELLDAARSLRGHLTATVWGTEADLREHAELLAILERKVGRLIINGFPTGVEVCHSMVHGGPFPATTDSRSTSVGTRAILRFVRPVCYQNFPNDLLPEELKDGNPLGIWRLVDGERGKR